MYADLLKAVKEEAPLEEIKAAVQRMAWLRVVDLFAGGKPSDADVELLKLVLGNSKCNCQCEVTPGNLRVNGGDIVIDGEFRVHDSKAYAVPLTGTEAKPE